jgi:hypothetical protein
LINPTLAAHIRDKGHDILDEKIFLKHITNPKDLTVRKVVH